MQSDTVRVTQADREAAAFVHAAQYGHQTPGYDLILAGEQDEDSCVQAFARHRIAATAAERERAAGIAAAHKPDRKRPLSAYDPEDRGIIRSEENGEKIAAATIATAIRQQPTSEDEG